MRLTLLFKCNGPVDALAGAGSSTLASGRLTSTGPGRGDSRCVDVPSAAVGIAGRCSS
jgi:hypothetical protein